MALLIFGLLAIQVEMAWTWSRSAAEWGIAFLQMGVTGALSLVLAAHIFFRRSGGQYQPQGLAGWLPWLWGLWLALMLMAAHGLVFDGRYRALVWPLLLGPVVLGATATLLGLTSFLRLWVLRWMATLAGLAGALVVYQEGLENSQALTYGGLLMGVALLTVVAARIPPWEVSGADGGPADDHASSSISGNA